MRLLIISTPNDHHATLALFVLRSLGHEVSFWSPADMPVFERASIRVAGPSKPEQPCGLLLGDRLLSGFDTVLFRKYASPQLPAGLHPADRAIAQREFRYFTEGCFACVAPNAFWVNPWLSLFTGGKVAQLMAAAEIGLSTPSTLISCDPERIREFAKSAPAGLIFKSFAPAVWQDATGASAAAMTAELTPAVLDDDAALSSAPAIYQHRIEKAHELRVTMFGTFGIFVKLESQSNEHSRLDWRMGGSDLPIEPVPADEGLRSACARLMARLGLSFGCVDCIVDKTGRVVFLEINPAGQFLWMEELNPDVRLLAPFCEFLAGGRLDYRPTVPTMFPSLAEIGHSAELRQFNDAFERAHAPVASGHVFQE